MSERDTKLPEHRHKELACLGSNLGFATIYVINLLASLCLCFPICQMDIILVPS